MSLSYTDLPSPDAYSPCIFSAISYVLNNFSSISSVKKIAEYTGCNYNTLRSQFRRETGVTLVKFLSRVRLERSCELLKDPTMQVKDIAWRVGYNNESHFTQSFRLAFGRQPTIYRSIILSRRLASVSVGCVE